MGLFPASLIALIVIQIVVSGAFLTVQVAAPEVAATLAVDSRLIGIFTALAYLGAMASTAAAGGLVASLGALRVCQVGLLVCALALALVATGWWPALVLGALVLGLGHAPVTPASSHVLVRYAPARWLSSVFSLKQAAVPLGGMVVGSLVPAVAVAFGWRAGILCVAALCALAAVLVQPLRPKLDQDREPAHAWFAPGDMAASVRLVLVRGPLRGIVLAGCVFGALQWCFSAFFVAYLVDERGLALTTAGLAFAVAQGAGAVGRVIWGLVADRLRAQTPTLGALGLIMAAAGIALAAFQPGWPFAGLVAVSAVLGLSAIGWNGVLLAEVARLAPPGAVAAATGGFVFAFAATIVVAPPLFALAAILSGSYAVGYIVLAVACALAGGRLLTAARARTVHTGAAGAASRPNTREGCHEDYRNRGD